MGQRLMVAFTLMCMVAFTLNAHAATDADVLKVIQEKFPNAQIVSKADCDLGKKRVKSVGAVIRKRSADENPLEAVVVQDVKGKLSVTVLPKKLNHSNALDTNFLHNFWDASTKHAANVNIRCVVPGKDKDITTKANGEFKEGFTSKIKTFFGAYKKHICFAASSSYNSWTCFNFGKSGALENSYVQMNAD